VGAWIETQHGVDVSAQQMVAPLVGAWIETDVERERERRGGRRAPRGCVD